MLTETFATKVGLTDTSRMKSYIEEISYTSMPPTPPPSPRITTMCQSHLYISKLIFSVPGDFYRLNIILCTLMIY